MGAVEQALRAIEPGPSLVARVQAVRGSSLGCVRIERGRNVGKCVGVDRALTGVHALAGCGLRADVAFRAVVVGLTDELTDVDVGRARAGGSEQNRQCGGQGWRTPRGKLGEQTANHQKAPWTTAPAVEAVSDG